MRASSAAVDTAHEAVQRDLQPDHPSARGEEIGDGIKVQELARSRRRVPSVSDHGAVESVRTDQDRS